MTERKRRRGEHITPVPRGEANRFYKHGLSKTHEYRVWQMMRLRCTEPSNQAYPDYGGRGITICAQWMNDPVKFIADVGLRPSPKHEIDRIDNDRGYEPGNVRWVTRSENSRNRRNNVWIDFRGERKTQAEWCERFGVPSDTLRARIASGWSFEEAFTTPVRRKRSVRQGSMPANDNAEERE